MGSLANEPKFFNEICIMAILCIPTLSVELRNPDDIRAYLQKKGIFFDQWQAQVNFAPDADSDTILAAYDYVLKPYMQKNGYKVADVVNIQPDTPNLEAIRLKFLSEHTHREDEVRFFVEGEGKFWFNLDENEPVFYVLCQKGDLISVPAGTKHWFDAGAENPRVKAIRIFIDPSGWVPEYTQSGIDLIYSPR